MSIPRQNVLALVERARSEERSGAPERALEAYDDALAALSGDSTDPLLVDVLRWKGTVHRERGETTQALALYQRSVELAERSGHTVARAHGLNCLAIVAQRRGDVAPAEHLYAQAALHAAAARDHRLLGMIEQNQGVLASTRGDLEGALLRYRMSLKAFEHAGDDEPASWVLNNLGMLHTDLEQFDEAETAYQRGLELARRRGDVMMEGHIELNRAEGFVAQGRLDEASSCCERALQIAVQRKDHLRRAQALKCRAVIERRRGDLAVALGTLQQAQGLAKVAEDALLGAEILRELGEVCRERGDGEQARSAWALAYEQFTHLGASRDAGRVATRLGALR
jgi:tetratricopeptide (TPR) repeat protein